jgi:hypothetical protein
MPHGRGALAPQRVTPDARSPGRPERPRDRFDPIGYAVIGAERTYGGPALQLFVAATRHRCVLPAVRPVTVIVVLDPSLAAGDELNVRVGCAESFLTDVTR